MYYIATDLSMTSQDLEQVYVDLVSDVRKQIHIPLAVKLSPFFTSLPNMAARLVKAGANGLVLFNRFYAARHRHRNSGGVPRTCT